MLWTLFDVVTCGLSWFCLLFSCCLFGCLVFWFCLWQFDQIAGFGGLFILFVWLLLICFLLMLVGSVVELTLCLWVWFGVGFVVFVVGCCGLGFIIASTLLVVDLFNLFCVLLLVLDLWCVDLIFGNVGLTVFAFCLITMCEFCILIVIVLFSCWFLIIIIKLN